MSLPVVNQVETVSRSSRSAGGSNRTVQAAPVHAPAQALPGANTETVRPRWASWSLLTSIGVGSRLCHGVPRLAQAVSNAPQKTMLIVWDNLGLNSCIHGLEERALREHNATVTNRARKIALYTQPCLAHSLALIMKPLVETSEEAPGMLIRFAFIEIWQNECFLQNVNFELVRSCIPV